MASPARRFRLDPDAGGALPASPPPEVLSAIARAWARAAELARAGHELHFELDAATGRVRVELRGADGATIRALTGAEALEALE